MGDYIEDPYPYAKFHHDTITPVRPQICENAHEVTRLVFLVLPFAYSQDRCTDFHDQYVKWRGLAQGCAFWSPENKILHFDPMSPKTQIYRQFLTGQENFESKTP